MSTLTDALDDYLDGETEPNTCDYCGNSFERGYFDAWGNSYCRESCQDADHNFHRDRNLGRDILDYPETEQDLADRLGFTGDLWPVSGLVEAWRDWQLEQESDDGRYNSTEPWSFPPSIA